MKAYRKLSGHYIELQDSTPVSELLVPVSQRPSINHVFSDTWSSDPMNPVVCWRLKTALELDAEKTTFATNECSKKELTAIVLWMCQKLSTTPSTAKSEIIAIWKGLP